MKKIVIKKTVKVYTAKELKRYYPDAFEKARDRAAVLFIEGGVPWSEETIDSLKAVYEAAGIRLKDWSISWDCPSYSWVKLGFPCPSSFSSSEDVENLAGGRALAWLESNLFGPLRTPWIGSKRAAGRKYRHYPGRIPECPLTGYCVDDDLLGYLVKEVIEGSTLKEAFEAIAYKTAKILEAEQDYMGTEEYFMDDCAANDRQFTKDGAEFFGIVK